VIDALGALVDRSFVVVESGDAPRYHLLQTAREYALLHLERSGELAVGRRHAEAMLATLHQTNEVYWHEQEDTLWDAVARDLDNVRAAVNWSIANDPSLAVQLVGAARTLLLTTGHLHEARHLVDRIAPFVSDATPSDAAAQFWQLCTDALQIDARERSAAAALSAITLLRAGGDPRQRTGVLFQAIVLTSLPPEAKEQLLLELRHEMVPTWPAHARATLLAAEAAVAWLRGDRLAARDAYQQAVVLARSRRWRAYLATRLAATEHVLGLLDDAVEHAREAVALTRDRGLSNRVLVLAALAGALIERGDLEDAREALVEVVGVSRRAGWWRMSDIARRFVCLATAEGRMVDAAHLLGYLQKLNVQLDPVTQPNEVHLQSLGEEKTRAALTPADITRHMAEGALLSEDSVCSIGMRASAAN